MNSFPLKLNRTFWLSPICLTVFLSPLNSQALTIQEVPNPRQINETWVTDQAEILSNETEAELNSLISELERKNGTEIAVVTVAETAPSASPKEFATALFNYWGIGKKEQNNGVLFLISVSDRRVEIETGYGLQHILPDTQVGNIINTTITPRFKQGDFDNGTLAGTKALVVALEPQQPSSINQEPTANTSEIISAEQPASRSEEPTQNTGFFWVLFYLFGVVAFMSVIFALLKHSGNSSGGSSDSFSGGGRSGEGSSGFSGSTGSSGSSGGSSSGGFGGGSSGGGGAGGSF